MKKQLSLPVVSMLIAMALLLGTQIGTVFPGDNIFDQLNKFKDVLSLAEKFYVDDVDTKKLVESAITGMLSDLDPHSVYIPARDIPRITEDFYGSFEGIGIEFEVRNDTLRVASPVPGGPSEALGILAGDKIMKIDDSSAVGITTEDVPKKLRGKKGTHVKVSILRSGEKNLIDFDIVRDKIPLYSVEVSYMVQPNIGYVAVNRFSATTSGELSDALKKLKVAGMDRLILDLRNNGGGLLDQAFKVASEVLPAGRKIVYTRGRRPEFNMDYVSEGGDFTDVSLIVLVNAGSASASEIVSGAIQDHDRGLVVGESTFGKGLVQRVIPLADGVTAVAVTTAKYYTPSGRLIQRDYSDLDDYFLDPEASPQEDASLASPREVHHTDSGRVVYGGGGITPDHIEKAKRASGFLSRLVRENLVFDFVIRYLAAHPDIEGELVVSDGVFEEFRKFLESRKVPFTDEDLKNNRDDLSLRLRAQVAKVRHGAEAESRVLLEGDVQVQKALTLFDEAARLHRNGEVGRRHGPEAGSIASDPSL